MEKRVYSALFAFLSSTVLQQEKGIFLVKIGGMDLFGLLLSSCIFTVLIHVRCAFSADATLATSRQRNSQGNSKVSQQFSCLYIDIHFLRGLSLFLYPSWSFSCNFSSNGEKGQTGGEREVSRARSCSVEQKGNGMLLGKGWKEN